MKRILLFVGTNLLVVLTIGVLCSVTGAGHYVSRAGLNLSTLLGYASIVGFAGAGISLMLSKVLAKWTMGLTMLTNNKSRVCTDDEAWLVQVVAQLAKKAGIGMPEVATYEGDPNAFATGWNRNNSLIAVSLGLLRKLNRQEIIAVVAHEISHIRSGDMVTMTLVQGVVNTFTIFLSRVLSYAVDKVVFKNESGRGLVYTILSLTFDLVFGMMGSLVVMWFSRQREFAADAGAAELMGTPAPMVSALGALSRMHLEPDLSASRAVSGIAGGVRFYKLFASHPSFVDRIAALER